MVLCDIRGNINARDEYIDSQKAAEKEMKKGKEKEIVQFNHIYLGASCEPVTIAALAESNVMDEAFHDFRKKLRLCIQDLVTREDDADRLETTERVERRDVEVHATDQVKCPPAETP